MEFRRVLFRSCKLFNTEIFNCKLENCDVDAQCTLRECYFAGGLMDGDFQSGTLRGGTVGPNGEIGKDCDIITDTDSYFGTGDEDDVIKGSKKDNKKLITKGKI